MSVTVAIPASRAELRTVARSRFEPSAIAWAGTLAVASVAPFETLAPIVRLPWQSVSNVELVIVLATGTWGVATLAAGDQTWWRMPLLRPWLALVAVMTLSALAAPAWRTNALHMTARFAVAGGVFAMAASGTRSGRHTRAVLAATVVVAVVVAATAILEFAAVRPVLALLRVFRADLSFVGEEVRASGTLQYPTIASMYLEIAFAFGLGLLAEAIDRSSRTAAIAWAVALLVIAEAIVLTFTRAGLISMLLGLVVIATIARRRARRVRLTNGALVAVGILVAIEVVASHSGDATRRRLTTETQDAWYRASFDAPAALRFHTDATVAVPISVTNTGRATWTSASEPPFNASYHWVTEDGERVVAYEGTRTPFAGDVEPGATVSLVMSVRAPQRPGRYRLLWDIAQEGRLWFTTEPNAEPAWSVATVDGVAVAGTPVGPQRPLPRGVMRPGRAVLWRAAALMLVSHPLMGVGPDNYRLTYGDYARVRRADPRVHTNNMYLEIAVGAGLLGTAAFAWLVWVASATCRRALAASPRLTPIAGVAAAGAAILAHGLVDSFLGFTATYVAIAITLGLLAAAASGSSGDWDADRV